ncbi:MAG: YidB family protein [Piscinibacter sp.]
MGLLDSVIGALGQGGQDGQGGGGGQAALLQALLAMLLGGQQGGAGGGGLADLVARFQQGGLGDVIGSWVGTGQNLPVSPDQLGGVLGDDLLGQLTRSTGMNSGDLLGQLAQVLPQLVDHVTPQGQLPSQGAGAGELDLGSVLGQLFGGGR